MNKKKFRGKTPIYVGLATIMLGIGSRIIPQYFNKAETSPVLETTVQEGMSAWECFKAEGETGATFAQYQRAVSNMNSDNYQNGQTPVYFENGEIRLREGYTVRLPDMNGDNHVGSKNYHKQK